MTATINVDRIRPELAGPVRDLVSRVVQTANSTGRHLCSCVMYGSAVGRGYRAGKSDVNLLFVFDSTDMELLNNLRGIFRKSLKVMKSLPVVVDVDFMKNSTDVFPMEFLEWKERSLLVFGEDFLGGLNISQDNLRYQIEENLRGKGMRVAQGVLGMAPVKGSSQRFLESTLPNFLTVIRNILRLTGNTPDPDLEPAALITLAAQKTGVSLDSLKKIAAIRAAGSKVPQPEIDGLYDNYLRELKVLTAFVDSYGK